MLRSQSTCFLKVKTKKETGLPTPASLSLLLRRWKRCLANAHPSISSSKSGSRRTSSKASLPGVDAERGADARPREHGPHFVPSEKDRDALEKVSYSAELTPGEQAKAPRQDLSYASHISGALLGGLAVRGDGAGLLAASRPKLAPSLRTAEPSTSPMPRYSGTS
ncbi:hypothetical protein MRX96_003857 [Rhipicephalus microplus]